MLGIFKGKARNLQVGVDFLATGVAAVAVSKGAKNPGEVQFSDFLPAVGSEQQLRILQQWVSSHRLENVPCNTLIAKHDVQIFQIEKPEVEDSELLQAIGWKLKDLVSYDVSAAVVDVFDMPASTRTAQRHVNAVVANEAVVGGYVERIRASGLELQVIDIHDLASKSFSEAYALTGQTYALLQFGDNEGLLSIYHDGDLYFSRDLKMGVLDMDAEAGEEESLYDRLLLELQRSMDYFESHYGMGQVQALQVFPQTAGTEKAATYLQNYVAYDIDFIAVKHVGDTGVALDRHCFSAYCVALRGLKS